MRGSPYRAVRIAADAVKKSYLEPATSFGRSRCASTMHRKPNGSLASVLRN